MHCKNVEKKYYMKIWIYKKENGECKSITWKEHMETFWDYENNPYLD